MQNAMLAAIFLSLMPSVLLSGFVFPIENMPLPIRVHQLLLPRPLLRHAIRGIYLKGVGHQRAVAASAAAAGFSAGIVWLSASRFRRSWDEQAAMTDGDVSRLAAALRIVQVDPHPIASMTASLSRIAHDRLEGGHPDPPRPAHVRHGADDAGAWSCSSSATSWPPTSPTSSLAVCDYGQSAESRAYVDQLVRSGYFRIARAVHAASTTSTGCSTAGASSVALMIPPDFSAQLKRGEPAQVMAAVDGSNSNTAMIAVVAICEQITLDAGGRRAWFADRGGGAALLARHPLVSRRAARLVQPRAAQRAASWCRASSACC